MSATRPLRRIPSLDGMRAVALVFVLANHVLFAQDTPWLLLWDGQMGLRVFFVMSGFLITGMVMAEKRKTGRIDLKRFYLRRALRILPVIVVYLGALAALTAAGWLRVPAAELWTSLLSIRDWVPGNWYTGHFWSLSFEERFYLVWPSLVIWGVWKRAYPGRDRGARRGAALPRGAARLPAPRVAPRQQRRAHDGRAAGDGAGPRPPKSLSVWSPTGLLWGAWSRFWGSTSLASRGRSCGSSR